MSAQPVDYERAIITQITYREPAPATLAAVERIARMDATAPLPLRARIARAARPSERLRGI